MSKNRKPRKKIKRWEPNHVSKLRKQTKLHGTPGEVGVECKWRNAFARQTTCSFFFIEKRVIHHIVSYLKMLPTQTAPNNYFCESV